MKKIVGILLVAILATTASCKKINNYYYNDEKTELSSNPTLLTDYSTIDDNSSWTLTEISEYGDPDQRWWKFQSGDRYIIINPVDPTKFWKKDVYYLGVVKTGLFIKEELKRK